MATELNKLTCLVVGANTGFGDCVISPAVIAGAFKVPVDFELDAAGIAALQTSLSEAALAAQIKERIFPIHNFEEINDGTEDETIATMGYGGKYPVRDGDYDWTFRYMQGGLCLSKQLAKLSGVGGAVLFYDSNNILIGWKVGDKLKGIPLNFFKGKPWRPSDGSTTPFFSVRFSFKPQYINQEVGFVQADFNLATIEGLQDVALKDAVSVRPAMKVTATVGCSKDNMYDVYADELAVVGAWKATINGNDIPITAVAKDETISGWTITLDDTDENYAAAPVPVVISLVDPTALAALDVDGFESNTVSIIT